MKKQWSTPNLEVLDVNETFGNGKGNGKGNGNGNGKGKGNGPKPGHS